MAWDKYKASLLEEKSKLEKELSSIATKNPERPDEWEVKAPDMNPMVSDQSELADMFEELETQTGLEAQLEERLKHVNGALKRIEEDKDATEKQLVGLREIKNKFLTAKIIFFKKSTPLKTANASKFIHFLTAPALKI